MKRLVLSCLVIPCLQFAPNIAQAALHDINTNDGQVVFDDVAKKYWVWDLHAFVNQTYDEQLAAISVSYAGASYFGISSWHMATLAEVTALFSYPALDLEAFNSTYTGIEADGSPQVQWYGRWVGQDKILGPSGVMHDSTYDGYMGWTLIAADARYANVGAWVTSAPVPEPETYAMMLAGLGLLGAVARRREAR